MGATNSRAAPNATPFMGEPAASGRSKRLQDAALSKPGPVVSYETSGVLAYCGPKWTKRPSNTAFSQKPLGRLTSLTTTVLQRDGSAMSPYATAGAASASAPASASRGGAVSPVRSFGASSATPSGPPSAEPA